MNDEDMKNLARIRYERAEELLKDAEWEYVVSSLNTVI